MELKHTHTFFVDANSAHSIMNIIEKHALKKDYMKSAQAMASLQRYLLNQDCLI